jgi:nitrite reductase/ring-hydroxylating ferredoxin subunit
MSFDVGWYPVALANGLERGRSTGTRLFGRELCIWRDSAGNIHAWEDRCPHRGMRLSFGFVRGDRIACLYHGWQYDGQGQCRLIPAHPDLEVPATIRVTAYNCVEKLGMVWVYSDRDVASPQHPQVDAGEVTPVRSLYVNSEPGAVMDALAARVKSSRSIGGALLSLGAAGDDVMIGVQPYSDTKTALHIVLDGSPTISRAVVLHAVAAWSVELRHLLEQGADSTARMHEAVP